MADRYQNSNYRNDRESENDGRHFNEHRRFANDDRWRRAPYEEEGWRTDRADSRRERDDESRWTGEGGSSQHYRRSDEPRFSGRDDREYANYGSEFGFDRDRAGRGGYRSGGSNDRDQYHREPRPYPAYGSPAQRHYDTWDTPSWDRNDNREPTSFRGDAPNPNTRGRFEGRGPKGYTRSDERIREDVSDRLARHGDIDASDIDLDVKDGEVSLKGTVDSRRTKRLVEDACDECHGVRQVHNQLRVDEAGWRGRWANDSSTRETHQDPDWARNQSQRRSAKSADQSGSREPNEPTSTSDVAYSRTGEKGKH